MGSEMMKDATKKPLVPYHPNATRNCLPVRFPDEPVPKKRFCKPNNISQFVIKDGSNSDATRFNTTNKNTYIKHSGVPVGFATNAAIVSEKTRWIRKRLND